MPISSASTRVFKAEDPVMETDLQLLAKVNEYQQEKFDEGEKNLQNEINNWSMLANVAKPQDRDYINAKLNKLVSGIQQMGGVDLSDVNNVNALKAQGYNLYGDDNVMNPVLTTRKMNALQQDIYNKTNGKNAKDYDNVYGEYLLNQYQDWLNDGQQGSKFDGPTSLPQGSFDNYNKKVSDALNKLTPDLNEAPQNAGEAWNYYQVGDKFIKKDRVIAAINAVTSAQDRDVMSAHAWKSMGVLPDAQLLALQNNSYNSKLKDLQDTYNTLQHQKSLTSDFQQKELFTSQMNQIKGSIDGINKQKQQLATLGQSPLDKGIQKQLRDNLFNEAYQDQWATARAFEQKKVELKMNQGRAEELKFNQHAYEFGKMYDIHLADLDIKRSELKLKEQETMVKLYGLYSKNQAQLQNQYGVTGPALSAPLSLVTNHGKDDAIVLNNDAIKQADANYIAQSNNFYTQGYDYLMGKDANLYGNYLIKDADGHWVPKDDRSRDIVNKGLQSAVDMYGNIANMSIKERNGLKLGDDDLQLFQASKDLKNAQLYKDQIKTLTDQVFRNAGYDPPSQKNVNIKFKNGTEVNLTYDKLKEMIDRNDPKLKQWKDDAKDINLKDQINKEVEEEAKRTGDWYKARDSVYKKYDIGDPNQAGRRGKPWYVPGSFSTNALDVATDAVKEYYGHDKVKDAWKNLSKDFNVYGASVTFPTDKNGKMLPAFKPLQNYLADEVRKQHPDQAGGVQNDDINVTQIYPVFNPSTNETKYMAKVTYQKGGGSDKEGKDTKGDRSAIVDVTPEVLREHGSGGGWLSLQYADDDSQVVYGMLLNNEGKTPLDKSDGYASALQTHSSGLLTHRYQVVAVRNKTNGIDAYRVNLLVPKGKDQNGVAQYQTLPVINFDAITPTSKTITNQFPSNLKYVEHYMDSWFSDGDRVREFYQRHGIPYLPQDQTQTNQ